MSFDPNTARPEAPTFDPNTAVPDGTPPVREVVRQALKTKPDTAAEVERLLKRYPAPYEVVERNVDDFRLFDAAEGIAAQLKGSPLLDNAIRQNPRLAAVAHDDIEPLAKVESGFAKLTAASVGQAVLGVSESIWRTPDAAQRMVGYLAGTVEKTGLPPYLNPVRGVQDVLRFISEGRVPAVGSMGGTNTVAEGVNNAQKLLSTDTDTFGTAFKDNQTLAQNADKALALAIKTGKLQQVGQVVTDPKYWSAFIGQAVPSLAIAMKSGGSLAVIGWLEGMGTANNAAEFEQKTGQKISDAEFTQAVIQTATVNALLERFGLDKIMGAKGQGLKGVVKAVFGEGGTEGLQQLNSNLSEALAYDGGKSLSEGVLASIMGGAGAGGGASTAAMAASRMQQMVDQRARDTNNAQQQSDALQNLMSAAGSSALRERSPEQFREVVSQMAEGAAIHVDAQVLNQLAPDVLAQLPESVRAQIPDAALANGTVEIPMADVLTVAPGTPLEQVLNDNARMTPESMSRADAQAAGDQAQVLRQEAERVIQQAADAQVARADYDTVKQQYAQQIAATGRYRPAVAEQMGDWLASFYTAYGARTGMTAVEFQAKYPVRIAGAPGTSGQVIEQGKLGEISVEGYHYSKAARSVITTGAFGTGLQGSNRDEYLNATDKRRSKRAYFYVDKGTGINPEAGVGGIGHRATLTNIYDADTDPLRLAGGSRADLETKVLDAGFSGYLSRMEGTQSGQVIMLGDQTIQPEVLGPLTKTTGKVVPPKGQRSSLGRDVIVDALNANKALPSGSPTLARWQELLARTPDALDALRAAGVFDGDQTENVYKSELVKRFIKATEAPVYEQRGEQKPGKPVPGSVDAVANVQAAFELANGQQFKTNRELKLALQERVLEALKAGKINLENFNAGAEQYLVRVALTDAEIALETNPNAVGWYNEKVTKALRLVALVHPEIQTDPQAKFAFVWAMAVTSNGLKVDKNFELAEQAYSTFKSTGKMPTDIQAGQAQAAINNGLALFNEMLAKHGFEALQSFMTTKATVKEIQAFSGLEVGGENLTTEVYGSAILGPKIGNGFFSNLYGRFEQLTMDRWLMRTWGRWTGTLIETNPEQVRAKRVQLRSLIQGLDKDQKKAFETIIKRKLTVGDIDAVALAIWKASQKPVNRARMLAVADATDTAGQARLSSIMGPLKKGQKRTSFGDELRKVGNSLTKYNDGQKEAPSGPPERGRIRKVFGQTLARLQERYPALTMSDLQALLWYPEKRLYDAAKETGEGETGYEDDAAPDYANAAAKLAREKGVPEADIARTIEEVDNELRATDRAAGAGRTAGGEVPAGETAAGGVRQPGGVRGGPSLLEQQDGGVDGQTGDRGGRYSSGGLAPLEGAPTVAGATGPDPRIVAVAEQYARDNGIPLRRQASYAKVDPERAARIAAAYEAMGHAPQDPAVREAYDNLIKQTLAQYQALQAAGYQFYLVDETNDPYAGNPWNAMRDLRANQTMGVFATEAGFGSGATELNVDDNPLLADTGLEWGYGTPDGPKKRVLANDLFRAVHDAFGHGMEGAGFRAQGEENAWQAHVQLFTGSAVGAITSETRGQNSWLNYGPNGAANQTAKVEDTVFADQKTGLMPEWTRTEGVVESQGDTLEQAAQTPRGTFNPQTLELVLNPNANLSTFFHETGHFFLEVMADIASQPNAPAQIAEDMGTFLKWAGIADLQTWNALDLDGKRQYHERWAESVEQYVMEGKAPSVELQPLMRRFATWLKSVYGSMKAFLANKPEAEQTPLNDDIRRVMDRLLATDEQIAQANEVAGLLPNLEADAEAAERLNKRSMADLKWAVKARDQVITKLKKQAAAIEKGIREAVTAEVDQMPEARAKVALDALQVDTEYDGALAAYKAERKAAETAARDEVKAALLADNPDAKGLVKGQLLMKNKRDIDNKVDAAMIKWDQVNPKPSKARYATEMDLAMVADSFGYESTDAMLQAVDAFDRRDLIDGMTQQRMLEDHGDLIDERAIREAANEAVHNEARARSLATELRTQREMLGTRTDTGQTNAKGSKITVNALAEAAKQFAANVVSKTVLRDLKAKAWQHTAAERRASKRWQEATAAGKTAEAVQAKQDQMLNNAAAKAAIDAKAEMGKILEFFKRVVKGNDEKVVEKGRDPDIVNAARAVLRTYGIETGTTKSADAYLETLQKNDPDTHAVVAPMVEGATRNAQPIEALTFEELQALHEEVQAMWHLAKRSRQMEVDGNLMDVEDAAGEVYARLEEIGIPDTIPGETGALTKAELLARQWLQQIPALGRRVEQWAEGKDGKFGGPFLRFIFQPVKDAADRYRSDRLAYRKKFQALVDAIAPMMRKEVIAAPELGYTFGRGHNGIGMAELLHAILHTGNASNKRKLLLGRGWATDNGDGTLDTSRWDTFIRRMADEGKLTAAHYDFAQGVWDLMEQTKPLAQKTHRDVFGRYFAEVTADAFVDPFGVTRAGGYVPAQADPLLVQDADLRELLETENAGMTQAFPATNKGFTKGRVEYNRPLKLDLRTLPQHIDKVLLFSHMEPAVRGAAKLLRQKNVSQPLARVDPAAMGGMIKPWLNRSARQTVETPVSADAGLNRMASTVRGRVGMALMFGNVSNTLQQFTGVISASLKVKPSMMRRAAAQYIANPGKFKDSVWALSPYMADRASNEVAVLSDTLEAILINPSVYEKAEHWTRRHGYFLQTALDNQVSPIIWTGAYNQALAEGMDDRMAIRYADGVIRQTQGSTLPEDVSRIETGPAYARLFTQFIGYFNMLANTNATALQQIAGEQGFKKGAGKAFGVVMLGLLAPIWVAEAIAHAMRGGPEDEDDDGYLDDWLAAVFGFGTIRGMLAGVPFLGAAAQSAVNRFNDQPADDKFSLSPTVSVLESAVGAPASVYKAIVDDASAQKAVRDVSALITVATGLPAMAAARPLGYAAGMADNKIQPTSGADAARGLITGTASPESKAR